jgi:putative FmdB family regulatory protein
MPLYEYRCEAEACGHIFELSHAMKESPAVRCPLCDAEARKVITGGSGFIMKQGGKESAISCGREQTCCGRSSPCETKPCHE